MLRSLITATPRILTTTATPCPACFPLAARPAPPRTIRARPIHSSPARWMIEATQKDTGMPVIGVDPIKGKEKALPSKRRPLKARKAAIELTPTAVEHLRALLATPTPQLVRVGVRNKGCAGMSYHLEYVSKPEKFDEVVEQDGVKVVIDSKALFSIIGSTMDWREGPLGEKFVFDNPNIKDACGCGESFIV